MSRTHPWTTHPTLQEARVHTRAISREEHRGEGQGGRAERDRGRKGLGERTAAWRELDRRSSRQYTLPKVEERSIELVPGSCGRSCGQESLISYGPLGIQHTQDPPRNLAPPCRARSSSNVTNDDGHIGIASRYP